MSLDTCSRLPDATVLNLGGGYKIGRVKGEETTNLQKIGSSGKCVLLIGCGDMLLRDGRDIVARDFRRF
jgi:hypothetical protein